MASVEVGKSFRGITTAPDVSFALASWEQHLSWRIGNHVGSDHLPIVIEIAGGKPAKSPRRKATYKKADWDLFHQSLDEALQDWDISPPTTATRANAFLSAAILKAAKKAIPKGSRKTQCAWWSSEVEDAVILRRQAQEALKADPDDDMKATAYQEAAAAAQTTTNDAKTKLWREFISDSHGNLTPAEVWAVIRTIDGRSPASAPSSVITSDDGKVAASNSAKAKLFCQEYATVSRLTKDKVADADIKREARSALSSPCSCTAANDKDSPCSDFTSGELERALFRLPARSAAGPEGGF